MAIGILFVVVLDVVLTMRIVIITASMLMMVRTIAITATTSHLVLTRICRKQPRPRCQGSCRAQIV